MAAMSKIPQRNGKGLSRVSTGTRARSIAGINDVMGAIAFFYRQAAAKSENPDARITFLSMADDEQRQIEAFGPMPEADREEGRVIGKMIGSLEKSEGTLLKRIDTATDEVGALRIAMEMEKVSIRFYRNLLPKMDSPAQKEIVARLLKEEQLRYSATENSCLFLSSSGNWFLWEEQSCADGGTPWA